MALSVLLYRKAGITSSNIKKCSVKNKRLFFQNERESILRLLYEDEVILTADVKMDSKSYFLVYSSKEIFLCIF